MCPLECKDLAPASMANQGAGITHGQLDAIRGCPLREPAQTALFAWFDEGLGGQGEALTRRDVPYARRLSQSGGPIRLLGTGGMSVA